ncbi:hypothetical protein ACFYYR_11480 [Streptomyces sp. NPDC001922]|uniref:hypothetical protein n=1 Tax=Streptomyces sp. NPDC001922 TaxID=3364624 RepID=UPI003679B6EB
MPDRRRRAALRLPLSTAPSLDPAGLPWAPAAVPVPLLRERRPSASPSPDGEDNPFAAPPEGRPDQPWRPRAGQGGDHDGRPDGDGGSGDGQGDGGRGNGGDNGQDGNGPDDDRRSRQQHWGSQWSSRQPGRQSGGFGTRPGPGPQQNNDAGGPHGEGGPKGPGGPAGLRWDPTDPLQRRARYALLAGMWAFFFALFSIPEVALLLGALALYWGVSSLRGKPVRPRTGAAAGDVVRTGSTAEPGTPGEGAGSGPVGNPRQQTTAAVSGLVTASLALAIVAATFSFQIVYRDYYTCVNDALTQSSRHSCEDLLPEQLRPLLSTRN